jgi:hypothetical protein
MRRQTMIGIPLGRLMRGVLVAVVLSWPAAMAAQDSTPPAAPVVDTARHRPVSPMGAFFRSLLVPGWGQAKLDRKLTGGIFVAWEGVTLGMTLKTSHELHYLRRTGSGRVETKEQEREDWIVLMAFNHLLSGLEAYVSAHLWDFPEDLKLRAVPGGVGGQLSLPPLR